MTSMNISLPDSVKSFVDEQVAEGGYSSASEYVRDLVREAKKRAADERLEKLLLEGINSGPDIPITKATWTAMRRRLQARLRARGKHK